MVSHVLTLGGGATQDPVPWCGLWTEVGRLGTHTGTVPLGSIKPGWMPVVQTVNEL